MDAGRLDRRIDLKTPAVAENSFGKNGAVSYSFLAQSVPAFVKVTGGGEVDIANKRQAETYLEIVIRYRSDINAKMLVVYEGSEYGIDQVNEDYGHFRKSFTQIIARRRA
ncbi:MAG: head-tail adaptor protein [Acinetobacter sp.]|uniref:phage head closure protein n=1 Tax=Acinetobacter sp. TaxID=472 RepID=UPI000FAB76DA|nr:phage head closure protein [Acinetobacter sp.]RUP37052.1 MAG: head-tail adaptor protein [Acinetobacter sp.]